MQTKELESGSVIRYYEDIEEFPIDRRSPWVKHLTRSGGLDMTIEAQMARLGVIMQVVANDQKEDAQTLLTNYYYSLNAINQLALSPDSLALGVLIGVADGQPNTDLSDNALTALLKRLNPTQKEVDEILTDVKKNSRPVETAISLGLL